MPLGPWELGIILVIVIIIFGAGKLPEIGGALGNGIREFRETSRDEEQESGDVHSADSSSDTRDENASSEPNRKNQPVKEEL